MKEPEGGLLATLLSLPGTPAVALDLNGDGLFPDGRARCAAVSPATPSST